MIGAKEVKDYALSLGADICGIAPVERFTDSPKGFHPTDIYKDARSVIVFAVKMPSGILSAATTVPYAQTASILCLDLDKIGLKLSSFMEKGGMRAVPVPSDNLYEHWDADSMPMPCILSMRHAGYLAGLGVLGKNMLLINMSPTFAASVILMTLNPSIMASAAFIGLISHIITLAPMPFALKAMPFPHQP